VTTPPDPPVGDEWVPLVACLLAIVLLLQAVAGGQSRRAVLVCAGVYFAATVLVQGGRVSVRLLNAATFTAMLAGLGFLLGLAIRP
jgi:hypothetical protein